MRHENELIRKLEAAGCVVTVTRRKGHLRIGLPDGTVTFTSGSTSDWRAVKNLRAVLRRAGVAV